MTRLCTYQVLSITLIRNWWANMQRKKSQWSPVY